MNEDIGICRLSGEQARQSVEALADLLADCVEGGASVGFLLPLPRQRAVAFWHAVADAVARGERLLLVARHGDGRIVGTVQLVVALPDNQPHRADVAKMLVHRSARRRGVAQRLMAEIEQLARAAGKSVLVLDTVSGGDAERLYQRAGWQRVGSIPNYALMPDGTFCATTYFHKPL
ncbi:acetyltransferase (GNAT) family protein [Tahibacter aquaticus]|uniref:Acetyltransferase (GNAT) family protein n=1 Tax=Tahibacter aquaticus TaxID=520092 RepID=A0A4R6YQH2_9GAMM|nr:GNAT family N-acetyltransferase [Tahibacter aquaticus]TDR40086.1 acetyltransferase (GNAT) family protein [Tahibacter aquaticus]